MKQNTDITNEEVVPKTEYRLRFGNKNKRIYFVLLSTCTIFA